MTDDLDQRLRDALRDLPAPSPAPGHHDAVRAAVVAAAADEERPRAGLLPRLGAALSRRRVAGFAVAAAAAAAVALAVVLAGLPGGGPEPVSATDVLQRSWAVMSSGRTLSAEAVLKIVDYDMWAAESHVDVERYRFLLRTDGSYRLTRIGRSQLGWAPIGGERPADDIAYDARRGVLSAHWPGGRVARHVHYPFGPPDRWAGLITQYDLSAGARALQAQAGALLQTGVFQGRPVWVITSEEREAPSNPALGGSWPVYLITIDQETYLPVRLQGVADGVVEIDLSYRDMRVNAPLPRDAFTLTATPGEPVVRVDRGFRRVAPAAASALPGYEPLVPSFLPGGYGFARAAVAASATTANRLIHGSDVFSVQYSRGFDSLTVTTRTVPDPAFAADTDPFEPDPSWADLVWKRVRLTSGAFAGVDAKVVVAPRTTVPHLWAVKGDLLLTVAGGATADELVRVAESLLPPGD
jgi:hypothetical protein